MSMLKSALKYRNLLHYSVFPVSQDKKPLVKWEAYQKKLPTEEEIKAWWTKWPQANIGIATGLISGIAVIDLDEVEIAKEALQSLIPDSIVFPIAKTPSGGEHWYFACVDSNIKNNSRVVPGADLRANGGYVVAPPSIDGNGKGWRWLNNLRPDLIALPYLPREYSSFLASFSAIYSTVHNNASIHSITRERGGEYERGREREKEEERREGEKKSDLSISYQSYQQKSAEDCPQMSTELSTNVHECPQVSTLSTNVHKMFIEGRRDEDLFHVANCLFKGRMPEQEILQVLEKLALSCQPPFPLEEILIKIESAKKRFFTRERNLANEVEEWVLSTSGHFLSTDVHKCLDLSTRQERKNVSEILRRLIKQGVIEKWGDKNGSFRVVDSEAQNIDWYNASVNTIDIKYPFGIEQYIHTMPKNIIVCAGSPNAGKTAFVLNIIAMNMDRFKINYFSSEMGAMELRSRLQKFDFPISKWRFVAKERSSNFADVIKPEEINIIDFMELTEDFWKVGGMLKAIYDKLTTGIAIVALQKAPGATMARGGVGSLEKPRLYLTMEAGCIKIEKGKNWAQENVNPNGLMCSFKLVQGCKFIKTTEWHKEEELKNNYKGGKI